LGRWGQLGGMQSGAGGEIGGPFGGEGERKLRPGKNVWGGTFASANMPPSL